MVSHTPVQPIARPDDTADVSFKGYIGGIKKTRYWTPDGREILAVPSIREYVRRDANGKVIETGERDANLDKGWLIQPPQNPKLRCIHCDKWHDTEEEIVQCKIDRDKRFGKLAKKIMVKKGSSSDEVSELRKEVTELKDMFKQLMEKLGG